MTVTVLLATALAAWEPTMGEGLTIESLPVDGLTKLPTEWRSQGSWAVKPYLSFKAAAGKDARLRRELSGDGFIVAGLQPLDPSGDVSSGIELVFPGGSICLDRHPEGEGQVVSMTLAYRGKQLGQKKTSSPSGPIAMMLERKGNSFTGWYCKPGEKFIRVASLDWENVGPVVQAGVFGVSQSEKGVSIRVAALKVGGAKPVPQEVVTFYDDGDFIGTVKDGKANFFYTDGSAYRGGYQDGKKHGKGSYVWPDGTTYTGEYANDLMHGKGVYTEADGSKYAGDFVEGKMSGKGHFAWADGSDYVGDWKDGERSGTGTFTWPNGDKYEGEYKDDRETGGWFFSADGKMAWGRVNEKGEWVFEK